MSLSSTFLVYVAILIGLGLALTAAFSVADNYGPLDRVKKSRATRRDVMHAASSLTRRREQDPRSR